MDGISIIVLLFILILTVPLWGPFVLFALAMFLWRDKQ